MTESECRQALLNKRLLDASGRVGDSDDKLTSFLYELMRDHLTPGQVQALLVNAVPIETYCNGWLAKYARWVADELRGNNGDAKTGKGLPPLQGAVQD